MRAPGSSLDRVVLAGHAFGLVALYRGLPLQVPPSLHVANGTVWLGAPMVAFLLPAAVTLTDRLLRGLYLAPEGGEPGAHADAIYDAIMLRVSLLVIGTHGSSSLACSASCPVDRGRPCSCQRCWERR